MLKIKDIPKSIERNKVVILVVLVWIITISILVIKAYLDFFYSKSALYFWYTSGGGKPPPFQQWQGPGLTVFDMLIIIVVSLICGAILLEIKRVFYGSLITIIISFSLATVYMTCYIWQVLGWGEVLSTIEFGWSHALYWGFLNTFRAMFPTAIVVSTLSAVIGAFIRAMLYH